MYKTYMDGQKTGQIKKFYFDMALIMAESFPRQELLVNFESMISELHSNDLLTGCEEEQGVHSKNI